MPIVHGKTLIGWSAVREMPWHFAGLFAYREEAQSMADEMGAGYIARYGEWTEDSDTFIPAETPLPVAIAGSMFEPLPIAADASGRLAAVASWIDDHLAEARGGF